MSPDAIFSSGADSHQVTPSILLHNKRLNNLQDEFMNSYSDYKKQTVANAVSVGWIAPSITPRGTLAEHVVEHL